MFILENFEKRGKLFPCPWSCQGSLEQWEKFKLSRLSLSGFCFKRISRASIAFKNTAASKLANNLKL